jgi:MoaA/NifB/PqqE/SkfB family radical SAM enzyme
VNYFTLKEVLKKITPSKIQKFRRNIIENIQTRKRLRRRKTLQVQVHLVEHCNLNCKYCAHFSPIAEEEYIDIVVYERNIMRLSKLTGGYLDKLVLMGGEPLLHPGLTAIFDISRRYFPKSLITLNTNGVLLKKQNDDFWNNCNSNNIEIIITRYPIKLDMDALRIKAAGHNVLLRYFVETVKDMWKVPLNINGGGGGAGNFSGCQPANWCISLQDGRLFTCGTIPYIRHFNKYFGWNFKVSDNDCIDIFKAKDIDEILDFLCKPVPFCRYCNQDDIVRHLEWGVSKKDISEWT